jgi:sigma-E factor negative regulatory protein RseA
MTDPVKEQLSAFLDGELPEAELDLLLKRVHRDPGLQEAMGRYALAGEALRSRAFPVPSASFAAKISQAIAAETGAVTPAIRPAARSGTAKSLMSSRWLRPVSGAAIAAGVAVVAVMAVQPQSPETAAVPMASITPAPSDKYIVPTAATTPEQLVPAAYLAKYVMAHSEYALPLGRRTVLSSVLSDDESDTEPVDISTTPRSEAQP